MAEMRLELLLEAARSGESDPVTKAASHSELGITLTDQPDRRVVMIEARPTELWAKATPPLPRGEVPLTAT